jgi:hypothetical protein
MTPAPHIVNLTEARKLIAGIKGKKTFAVMARAFMPTTEDRGFEGSACVTVPRAVFLDALSSMLAAPYAAKGARLRIWVSPPTIEGAATFVSCY